jgi:hypothetical protein
VTAGAYLFFVLVGFGTILLLLCIEAFVVVRIVSKDRRTSTIRLRYDREPPELSLETDQSYHVFLSHVWSTGQDAVATYAARDSNLYRRFSHFRVSRVGD